MGTHEYTEQFLEKLPQASCQRCSREQAQKALHCSQILLPGKQMECLIVIEATALRLKLNFILATILTGICQSSDGFQLYIQIIATSIYVIQSQKKDQSHTL